MSSSVVVEPPVEPGWVRALYSVGRFHIVAIAVLACLAFGWALIGSYPWLAAAACACDWFLVNLLNRIVDLREDEANGIVGTGFVARHRRLLLAGAALLGPASLAATHLLAPALTLPRLGYHALGLIYNYRVLPGRRRLKQLYALKNTASDLGFLITCFGYPLAIVGVDALRPDVGLRGLLAFGAFFFLFELSFEVIYDLRDVAGDRAEGVASFAVVHGVAGAARLADALMLGSMVVLGVSYACGWVPWRLAVMLVAPAAQLVLYRPWLARGVRARDCLVLTWLGAILLALYLLWGALELPGVSA
ncbi:MAG: UbiA family prenyltransferase [Planctomycetes bacterium]|nr:UbiA family prenyltransferase [Planctomycetota bacterium]